MKKHAEEKVAQLGCAGFVAVNKGEQIICAGLGQYLPQRYTGWKRPRDVVEIFSQGGVIDVNPC